MSHMQERWIDVGEAANYLGVKAETVRIWAKAKKMPARKIGRCWKFRISEIDEWVKSGKSAINR